MRLCLNWWTEVRWSVVGFESDHSLSCCCGDVEIDDVVLEFTLNYRKKFFLYGKFLEPTIKFVSAKSNVRIFFPADFKPREQSFSEAEPMTLEGSFADVLK